MTPAPSPSQAPPPSILARFGYLLGAFGFRELLQAAFFIALARLRPALCGELFLGMTLGEMVRFVSELGINQHLATMLARRELSRSILAQVTLIKASLLAASWVALTAFVWWQGYPASLVTTVLIMGAGFGLEALASSFFVALQIQGRQRTEGSIRCAGAAAAFALGGAALFTGAAPWVVALYKPLETAILLVASFLAAWGRLSSVAERIDLSPLVATVKDSLVYTVMALVTLTYNRLNILRLQELAPPATLAQYGVAWLLVDGVAGLTSELLLRGTLFPFFLDLWNRDRPSFDDTARSMARTLLTVGLLIWAGLFLWADHLVLLLYGPEYGPAAWALKVLAVCVTISFVHNLSGYLMIAAGRVRSLLGAYLLGLAVNLIACRLLIPADPFPGAVWAILVTRAVVAAVTVGTCHRAFGLLAGEGALRPIFLAGPVLLAGLTRGPSAGREIVEIASIAPLVWYAVRHRSELLCRVMTGS